MRMRVHLAIAIGRLARVLSAPFSLAHQWPGRISARIYPDILYELTRELEVVLVAGSNGTAATASFIAHGLESTGLETLTFPKGRHTISSLISDLLIRPKTTHAVLRVRPAEIPAALQKIQPRVCVLTSLKMDGDMDKGTVDRLRHAIQRVLSEIETTLVIPSDDPLLAAMALEYQGTQRSEVHPRTFFYAENRLRLREAAPERTLTPYRTSHCPRCTRELTYTHVGSVGTGRYRCHNCGFTNPTPDLIYQFHQQLLTLQWTQTGTLPGEPGVRLESRVDVQGEVTARYLAAALGALHRMLPGENIRHLQAAVSSIQPERGRQECFNVDGRELMIQMVPRPQVLNEHLELALEDPLCLAIVLWLDDADAKGRDLSMLWDIDMEALTRASGLRLIVGGPDADFFAYAMTQQFVDTPKPERVHDAQAMTRALEALIRTIPQNHRIYIYPEPEAWEIVDAFVRDHRTSRTEVL